ncbi:MAG TPA: hypothetical protein VF702_04175 [Allosphingosinicella sp.]
MKELFGRRRAKGTGVWPMVLPRPWDLTPEPGATIVIDPIAVSQEAARELQKVGWPGIGLMDDRFLLGMLEEGADVSSMAANWFRENRAAVAAEIDTRASGYGIGRVSKSIEVALKEASASYAAGRYLTTVRVLMPEVEGVARSLVTDRSVATRQRHAIEDFKQLMRGAPMIQEEPVETMSMYEFIQDQLFAACHSEADAQALGGIPNRHAELHGLKSYGNLQGASLMLCATDLLLRLACRILDLGYQPPSGLRS